MSDKKYRIEHDSMGELKVPEDALWGAQTQRAVDNFPISGLAMPRQFIAALGLVAAAPLMSLAVGLRHQRQLAPLLEARRAAERLHARHEEGPLGVTYDAMKAGILSGAELERYIAGGRAPCVVLCNSRSYSYRTDEPVACELEGYRVAQEVAGYRVLVHVRCDRPGDARGPR